MAGSNITRISNAALAASKEALRKQSSIYAPGGQPFQFAVKTDKSTRFHDRTRMMPDYQDTTTRVTLVPSFTTSSLPESRREVIKLYRRICRRIPGIIQDYNLWQITGILLTLIQHILLLINK